MELSDGQLLNSAKEGDRDALAVLLERYGPPVRKGLAINPRWRPMLDPDDIMQATYFEVFETIDRFRSPPAAFSAWLRQIANNNLRDAVDWLKRGRRPPPERRLLPPADRDSRTWLYNLATRGGSTPSGHAAEKEMHCVLETEVSALPLAYQTVLRGLYFEGKTVGEVAEILERTPGAVYLLRLRAVERLRNRLGTSTLT